HRLVPRGRLADHRQAGLGGEHPGQPGPDHRVIVGEQDPDRSAIAVRLAHAGTRTSTVVPAPGALRTVSAPPASATLARMPLRPSPPHAASGSKPAPSSVTSSSTAPAW